MKKSMILGLGAVSAIGAALGCATLIGLSPAIQQACTNATDQMALGSHPNTFLDDVLGCTASNPGDAGAASACIRGMDGLSQPCADCSAAYGICATEQCGMMFCGMGAAPGSCHTCIASQCNAALIACGGTPVDACLDTIDKTALAANASNFETDVQKCSQNYPKGVNAVVTCFQDQDGLTQPCALCYAQEGLCALGPCKTPCVSDPTGSSCANCVRQNCGGAFTLCSGFPPDAGP
jgi:hypothetical protein